MSQDDHKLTDNRSVADTNEKLSTNFADAVDARAPEDKHNASGESPKKANINQEDSSMTINLQMPDITELKPKIIVFGVGGAGGNAVNNMIQAGLAGVDFVVANTDAQALALSRAQRVVQMGVAVTEGLGAGSQPEVGRAAAEEVLDEIADHLNGTHMVFITAGMGGGTGTGAAPVIARVAREMGILTVGVVTKPFHFEGKRRMYVAEQGIDELQKNVDTQIVIPNQNLFRIANEKTTFADAFAMADEVLNSGVACITDLMVKEGLINLDFADVRSIMRGMGKAMMGTGEASGDKRAVQAAEAAIANPLLDDVSMSGARGLLISITGGKDMTLFEVDEAATRIREEVDVDANIILGATFDDSLEGIIRVSVVATGIEDELYEGLNNSDSHTENSVSRSQISRAIQSGGGSRLFGDEAVVAGSSFSTSVELAQKAVADELALVEAEELSAQPAANDPAVTITPLRPDAVIFSAPEVELEIEEAVLHSEIEQPQVDFVPPMPMMADSQMSRIPAVEDFPPIAQRELKTNRGDESIGDEDGQDERGPIGLLRRLATVGLGRREDEEAEVGVSRHQRDVASSIQPRHVGMSSRTQMNESQSYQSQQASLDTQGREVPQRTTVEDDHLEIPAFLRRQAN